MFNVTSLPKNIRHGVSNYVFLREGGNTQKCTRVWQKFLWKQSISLRPPLPHRFLQFFHQCGVQSVGAATLLLNKNIFHSRVKAIPCRNLTKIIIPRENTTSLFDGCLSQKSFVTGMCKITLRCDRRAARRQRMLPKLLFTSSAALASKSPSETAQQQTTKLAT